MGNLISSIRSAGKHFCFIFIIMGLILTSLTACSSGPSAEELAAVDYTPITEDEWLVSTPEEQGLDPDLVAELYYNAAQLETA